MQLQHPRSWLVWRRNMRCLLILGQTSRIRATAMANDTFLVPGQTHPSTWRGSSWSLHRLWGQDLQEDIIVLMTIIHNIRNWGSSSYTIKRFAFLCCAWVMGLKGSSLQPCSLVLRLQPFLYLYTKSQPLKVAGATSYWQDAIQREYPGRWQRRWQQTVSTEQ